MRKNKFYLLLYVFGLGHLTSFSQNDVSYLSIDSAYRSRVSFINTQMKTSVNLKMTEFEVDRLRDRLSGSGRLLSSSYYNKFFDKYFTLLSFDKEGLPEGNSAALKTTSNETKLNLNLSYKKLFTVVNVGADLNLSSGTANIISGKNLTANSTYYLKFSFLNSGINKLWYNLDRKDEMTIRRNYYIREVMQEYNSLFMIRNLTLIDRLKVLDSTITSLVSKNLTQTEKDALIKNQEEKVKIRKTLSDAGLDINEKDRSKKLIQQLDSSLYDIEVSSNAWTNIRLGWFSGGVSYAKDKYTIYDSSYAFDKRISEKLFDRWAINLNFNLLLERNDWWHQKTSLKGVKSFYLNIGWNISKDNNYAGFQEYEFSNRQIFFRRDSVLSGDSVLEIQSTKKIRDVTGKVFKTNWSHTIGAQSTIILGKSNFWGINLGVNGIFNPFEKPLFNSKMGLLFRFIDSNDGKSKVNFELFLQLKDWSDNQATGKSTWQRKTIGIATTVPFNKVFFK